MAMFCLNMSTQRRWMKLIPILSSLPRSLRMSSTGAKGPDEIAAMLAQPSWSVKPLLEPAKDAIQEIPVTQKQLHHLLRLSALPLPVSDNEETSMIKDLQSQLHFVKAIQKVNTDGVEPLQSIRDETKRAERENMFTVQSLQDEFDKEVVVGRRGRITKPEVPSGDAEAVEDWDPLSQAPKQLGRYFVVEADKE